MVWIDVGKEALEGDPMNVSLAAMSWKLKKWGKYLVTNAT
jgi:hypothetical protein